MSAGCETGNETVSALFDKGLAIYDELCNTMHPSSSKEYQDDVKKSILILEDATRLVSSLGVFSDNENVDEVATNDLKLFLLPVLLGDLSLKQNSSSRPDALNAAEVYFKDFLRRCKLYSAVSIAIPDDEEKQEEEAPRRPGPLGFEEMARQRELKIRKFNEKKNLESKLAELKKVLDNPSTDDSTVRTYYLLLLDKFASLALEELQSISQEKPILEHLAKMKAKGVQMPCKAPNSKPLKPIIITRDAVQKKVYGLGYPSIPAMSVEELIQQRINDGWYDSPVASTGQHWSLQDNARNTEVLPLKEEEEAAEKERKTEVDDEEKIARERQFDDWKDDHRRGWGNRHNMG